ncbi:hypothetical protein A7982_13055 [Minicystis rosea]|nr:hypothetical protein A7982_13055 [Minicystis rosea]
MDEALLGTGWKFDMLNGIGPAQDGRMVEASGEDVVRQSIWLILSTAPGERVGTPDFGCGIHDLVFAPMSAGTLGEVIRAVEQALTRWEPRIALLDVDANVHPDDPSGMLIEIRYRVQATNSTANLVYPFYLST